MKVSTYELSQTGASALYGDVLLWARGNHFHASEWLLRLLLGFLENRRKVSSSCLHVSDISVCAKTAGLLFLGAKLGGFFQNYTVRWNRHTWLGGTVEHKPSASAAGMYID